MMAQNLAGPLRLAIDKLSPRAQWVWRFLVGWVLSILVGLLVLTITGTDVITVGGTTFSLYGWLLVLVGFGVVVMCGLRASQVRAERTPWILMTIANGFWCTGNLVWQLAYSGAGPFPSWSDALWIGFFLPAYASVVLLIRDRGLLFNSIALWVDGLIVIFATAGLATAFIYHGLAASLGGSVISTIVVLAYPIGDLAIMGALVMVLTFSEWRLGRCWYLLVVGLALKTAADAVFTYQTANAGFVYVFGGWLDFIWVASGVTLGFAAWQIKPTTKSESKETYSWMRDVVIPLIAAFATVILLLLVVTGIVDTQGASRLTIGFTSAALMLVMARGILGYRELFNTRTQLAVTYTKLLETVLLKDQVMSTVSHELRNPLTAVAGYTELLLDDVDGTLNSGDRKLLGRIESESAHLLHILDDLQMVNALEERGDSAVLPQSVFGPVDIAQVARHAVENVTASAVLQNVEVELYTDDKSIWIDGDEQRLRQVLDNLLSNAIKYSPSGGDVDLRIWHETTEIVVTVSDEGIGIAPEDQVLLFSRFFRASNAVAKQISGTGLGLSISKAIVELHGGTIKIDSDVGVGTVVTVCLPSDHARIPSAVQLNTNAFGV